MIVTPFDYEDVWVKDEFAGQLDLEAGFHKGEVIVYRAYERNLFARIRKFPEKYKLVALEEKEGSQGSTDIWDRGWRLDQDHGGRGHR